MELSNVRLLVKDFDKCFKFYSELLGLKVTWGKIGGDYASFDVGLNSNDMGLSIFKSDLMASAIGNSEKSLPNNAREKMAVILKVDSVDETYKELMDKGVEFINKPMDMAGWGDRVVHFRDPEGNLLELISDLDKSKWDKELLDEFNENNH
jgi:predicted enzyme related to lactoylglutathione lyase